MNPEFSDEIEFNGKSIKLHFALNGMPGIYYYNVTSEYGDFSFVIEQKKSGKLHDFEITKTYKLPSTTNKSLHEIASKINKILPKHIK